MRYRFTLPIVCSLLLMMGSSASAAPFIPKINEPGSYEDYLYGIAETRANVNGVACGGWADGGSGLAGDMPIPQISPDVPGRKNVNPLVDPSTGVGERGDFEYPDSAFGYLSACSVFEGIIFDRDLNKLGKKIVFDNVPVDEDPNVRVEDCKPDSPGCGQIHINPYYWCRISEKATPRWCEKLFKTWRRMAEIAPRPPSRTFCQCPAGENCLILPDGPPKRYCFDYDDAASNSTDPVWGTVDAGDYTKECEGQECRTLQGPNFGNDMVKCEWGIPMYDGDGNKIGIIPIRLESGHDWGDTSSFFRHYGNKFSDWAETKDPGQTPLTVQTPTFEWKVRVDCYHYYKEEDPKDIVTTLEEEQCEITILSEDEQNPESPQWKPGGDTEQQKGQYKVTFNEAPRDSRTVPDPWVADTETNLSMIDIGLLMSGQQNFEDPADITSILGAILPARQRAAAKATPSNARTDMTDDTDGRDFSTFWEAQQRELLKMVADPQTRLIMPARFLVGLSTDDPLYQEVSHMVSRSDGTVEITLKAGLEDIGNVLTSFQRMFVAPIQEVRIPLVVPLASVSEINARIFEWRQWQQLEDNVASNTTPPRASLASLADPHIQKLESYRNRAMEVRLLRGALIKYLANMYQSEHQIREYFASWYEQNTQMLLDAVQRAMQRRELRRIWRLLQRSMLQTDACQLLWCSNQRYSVPVYSLLDEWWGARSPGEPRDHDYRPPDLRDVQYVQPEDQLFDFSDVKFPREPWLIPVLWPVHVRVRLPQPPSMAGVKPPDPDEYPDLPDIPDASVFDGFPVPSTDLPTKSFITPPPTSDLEAAKDILREIRLLIDGTEISDQMLEEQFIATGGPIDFGDYFPVDRNNMRGAYCRFPPSAIIPPDSEQRLGNGGKIIHIENDMKERIARLFSRWMPERQVDFKGRIERIGEEFPDPSSPPKCTEDIICYLLPPERKTVTTWQWFMTDGSGGDFTGSADTLRGDTLPANDDENPYFYASRDVLKRIFPLLDLPIEIRLHPPSSDE